MTISVLVKNRAEMIRYIIHNIQLITTLEVYKPYLLMCEDLQYTFLYLLYTYIYLPWFIRF